MESVYERCLTHRFDAVGLRYQRQLALPIVFDGTTLDCAYRVDFFVEKTVVLEIKSLDQLLPIHSAQTLTYLKLSGATHGLLINFNVEILKNGIKSFVNPLRIKGIDV